MEYSKEASEEFEREVIKARINLMTGDINSELGGWGYAYYPVETEFGKFNIKEPDFQWLFRITEKHMKMKGSEVIEHILMTHENYSHLEDYPWEWKKDIVIL